MTSTLSFYIAKHFLRNVVLIFLLFLALITTVDLIELSRELSRTEGVSFSDIFVISVLRAPFFAGEVLAFACLFGAVGSFLILNRKLELVIARASGVSVWQFMRPMAIAAALLGLAASLFYGPLALSGQKISRAAEAAAFGNVKGNFSNKTKNFWLRTRSPNGDVVIRSRVEQNDGRLLSAVSAYTYNSDGSFRVRYDAERAEFVDLNKKTNQFRLINVSETGLGKKALKRGEVLLPVNIDAAQLKANVIKAGEVPIWSLLEEAQRAREGGNNPLPFVTQFQSLIAIPLFVVAMVLIAATVSLTFARFGQSGRRILGGILAGFVLYVLTKLVITFGSNGLVQPMLAAWTPAFVGTLIGVTILLYQEDG